LVMRNSIVGNNTHRALNVHEFRGFAMGDRYAPLIFMNSSDANSAKIFTLIHELAHLWIAQSGISDIDLDKTSDNRTEKFCNSVSAEVLTPQDEFLRFWDFHVSIGENCSKEASLFRVSTFVTARRAHDLGLVDAGTFYDYYRQESENFEQIRQHRRDQQTGGGSYYANVRVRNGSRFSSAVISSALEGRIPYREAAMLLNINASKIAEFSKELGIR
jgi:Zn-dependent peptidase ImmA (M78 family)